MTHESADIHFFEVIRYYWHGDYNYEQTDFYRGTYEALEQCVRSHISGFCERTANVTWTYDEQDATKSESGVRYGNRYLEISAREIDSLDDLYSVDL